MLPAEQKSVRRIFLDDGEAKARHPVVQGRGHHLAIIVLVAGEQERKADVESKVSASGWSRWCGESGSEDDGRKMRFSDTNTSTFDTRPTLGTTHKPPSAMGTLPAQLSSKHGLGACHTLDHNACSRDMGHTPNRSSMLTQTHGQTHGAIKIRKTKSHWPGVGRDEHPGARTPTTRERKVKKSKQNRIIWRTQTHT